jgi:hypothetical protein
MKKANLLKKTAQEPHTLFKHHNKKIEKRSQKSMKDFWGEPEQDRLI